jgi:hypothetical protein
MTKKPSTAVLEQSHIIALVELSIFMIFMIIIPVRKYYWMLERWPLNISGGANIKGGSGV